MEKIVTLPLKLEDGKRLFYRPSLIQKPKNALVIATFNEQFMHTLEYAKNALEIREIKDNNGIEGMYDSFSTIRKTIEDHDETKPRITNMHEGYQYILNHHIIDKESLKELYMILSKELLDEYSESNLGEYYRQKPVFIIKNQKFLETDKGVNEKYIDYYMDILFDYINSSNPKNKIENYIKSQIIHFYFVYIHPYFDINGRTARTLSAWHLLNTESYPYTPLNKAIIFNKSKYYQQISMAKKHGDVSFFIKYMLEEMLKTIERDILIKNIEENSSLELTEEERITLECLLNGNITAQDIVRKYNGINPRKTEEDFAYENIVPLISKKVLIKSGITTQKISPNMPNIVLAINRNLITIPQNRLNTISLKKVSRKQLK